MTSAISKTHPRPPNPRASAEAGVAKGDCVVVGDGGKAAAGVVFAGVCVAVAVAVATVNGGGVGVFDAVGARVDADVGLVVATSVLSGRADDLTVALGADRERDTPAEGRTVGAVGPPPAPQPVSPRSGPITSPARTNAAPARDALRKIPMNRSFWFHDQP
jgi:hypothetical protein